jgi:hypothetical protein
VRPSSLPEVHGAHKGAVLFYTCFNRPSLPSILTPPIPTLFLFRTRSDRPYPQNRAWPLPRAATSRNAGAIAPLRLEAPKLLWTHKKAAWSGSHLPTRLRRSVCFPISVPILVLKTHPIPEPPGMPSTVHLGASHSWDHSFEFLKLTLSSRGGREALYVLPVEQAINVIDVLEKVSAKQSLVC